MTDDTPVQKHGRGSDRRRVLKSGVVAYNNRHLTVPCAVRDISETGARLRVDAPLQVPERAPTDPDLRPATHGI